MIVVTKHGQPDWVGFKCEKCHCEFRATQPDYFIKWDYEGCKATCNCPECGRPCHTVIEERQDD